MGKCSFCGSPGTSASSCPLNSNALSPNPKKHPLAQAQASQVARAPAQIPQVARAPAQIPQVARAPAPYMEAKAPKLPWGQVGVNTKSWTERKPKSKTQRMQMSESCGAKCFLIPELRKYPVCAKGSCEYDCDGIRAARNLTHLIVNKPSTGEVARDRAMRARDAAQLLGVQQCGWS